MGRCAQFTAACASWGHWNQASLKRHSCRVDGVVSAGSCCSWPLLWPGLRQLRALPEEACVSSFVLRGTCSVPGSQAASAWCSLVSPTAGPLHCWSLYLQPSMLVSDFISNHFFQEAFPDFSGEISFLEPENCLLLFHITGPIPLYIYL